MRLPLVVGVDGSDSSLEAVDWAADEAVRHADLPLRLVHASLWEQYEGDMSSTGDPGPVPPAAADRIVTAATERALRRAPAVRVETMVLAEDPVYALLGEGHNATAVVTGCRGRGEIPGLLLGSVGLAVAGHADGPVIVVRGTAEGIAGAHERIVLAVGEPGTSGEAARFALCEAAARHCALDVVRTWLCPAHRAARHPLLVGDRGLGHEEPAVTAAACEEQASALVDDVLRHPMSEYPQVRVHRCVLEGPARQVLLHRSRAADLLVLGVRRRNGDGGLQLGLVAHALLHHALCPVAVVPDFP
ncbi:universal stress protein [Streptomyces sp. NPDC102462]|uniref:universal stress protein n=1 Tax=Streptomyces sp. NPDC102462 TaxID=3366178 RepID=UPI0038136D22